MTTTGFGDIALPGMAGKLTSIVTMIVGISLFVRLAQAIFRPDKVFFRCPHCGLQRHEPDAVHCKACGHLLNIPDEGEIGWRYDAATSAGFTALRCRLSRLPIRISRAPPAVKMSICSL